MEIRELKFENVSFNYEGGAPVFENASFEFPMDKIVWIQGETGAGRSTLLQLMASLCVPQSGGYYINGENMTNLSFEEFLPYRLSIGYGFDMHGVIHNRTLHENLTLPLFYHKTVPGRTAIQRADHYLERMGIAKWRDQRPSTAPGIARKIVCLLRALIMHPQVLLLDDPTVGLGRDVYLQYFDLVSDLRSEGHLRHIFMSSFDEHLFSLLKPVKIAVDNGQIHHFSGEDEKKVANL